MADKAILDACRSALRIPASCTDFDDEIGDLIGAGRATLRAAGVSEKKSKDDSDQAIRLALAIYVKANFGLDNPDRDSLMGCFDTLLTTLAHDHEFDGRDET